MRISVNKLDVKMAETGINFTQLSNAAKVSRATLSYIKNGKACRCDTVHKIAKALGVSVESIIEV